MFPLQFEMSYEECSYLALINECTLLTGWHLLGHNHMTTSAFTGYLLYLSVQVVDEALLCDWSCPIRIRLTGEWNSHCVAVPLLMDGKVVWKACALSVSPGDVTRIGLVVEPTPQIVIHNECDFDLMIGQSAAYLSNGACLINLIKIQLIIMFSKFNNK